MADRPVRYWLMKSEPDMFGISDLERRPRRESPWDGVRNYQARNFLRAMQRGDRAFFYHSSCTKPGIAGIVEITRAAYPDPTAWDRKSPQYDPRSSQENPVWDMVNVRLVQVFARPVTLAQIKSQPALSNMRLVQRGNRLSVMPVTTREWNIIMGLEQQSGNPKAN